MTRAGPAASHARPGRRPIWRSRSAISSWRSSILVWTSSWAASDSSIPCWRRCSHVGGGVGIGHRRRLLASVLWATICTTAVVPTWRTDTGGAELELGPDDLLHRLALEDLDLGGDEQGRSAGLTVGGVEHRDPGPGFDAQLGRGRVDGRLDVGEDAGPHPRPRPSVSTTITRRRRRTRR